MTAHSEKRSKLNPIKEVGKSCGHLLSQAIDLYPRLGSEFLSIDLMADYQRPIQAKAYQFSDLKICLDEINPNLVVLDLQTTARLQAQAAFNRKGSELIYQGLQILNDQKTPPAWEAPTSPMAEFRIIEATSEALKQILPNFSGLVRQGR